MVHEGDPPWLRAVAVAAALAGMRDASGFAGLCAPDAAVAARRLAALRASGERTTTARAIAREVLAVTRPGAVPLLDPAPGARFVACWLRGMSPADRALVARRLDPATARAVTAAARLALVHEDSTTALWLAAQASDATGRLPTATEWTAVLLALATGADTGALAATIERRARVCGRGARCAALARTMVA